MRSSSLLCSLASSAMRKRRRDTSGARSSPSNRPIAVGSRRVRPSALGSPRSEENTTHSTRLRRP